MRLYDILLFLLLPNLQEAEVYFDKKRAQQSGSTDAKGLAKTKRDERLAVTGMEESRARRTATSGMNANEARKALAEELKRRIKN